ncbi:MAG: MFS transporter [Bacteroidota bacterium]|nr:MFS transporter [Bacteroidota bacterium]
MKKLQKTTKEKFTKYEVFMIAILAITQFTIILDFMVMSPMGAIMMPALKIDPSKFGNVVSAYAFSAGISAILTAGFADKFDRKKLLLFFYTGFIIGTFLCGIATDYDFLLIARIVTGIFGGVIGSIGMAILADIFAPHLRSKVMGFVQMAFASSQILGIPIGLKMAKDLGWNSPFLMIVGLSIIIFVIIIIYMKPVKEHLKIQSDKNAFVHMYHTLTKPFYLQAFLSTILLATGGYMLMPFGSAFSVNNLKLSVDDLPSLYLFTGISALIAGPLIGKFSEKVGKYRMFVMGSFLSMITIIIYANLGPSIFSIILLLNCILMISITARIVTSSTIMTSVPLMSDRGAFMSTNSAIQMLAGGIAAKVGGMIVSENADHSLVNYDTLCYVVSCTIIITAIMMYFIDKKIKVVNVERATAKKVEKVNS